MLRRRDAGGFRRDRATLGVAYCLCSIRIHGPKKKNNAFGGRNGCLPYTVRLREI